jgi:putative ABC transport system permease protein
VGRIIRCVDDNGRIIPKRIIGVTKDFHYQTARQKPEPMIFFLDKRQSPLLMVRIVPGQSSRVLPLIQEACKQLSPGIPFRSVFLDETFEQQFNRDRDFLKNISLFAGLAIFIACLGLTGLIAYSIEQRNKEIAIRKILGCRGSKVYQILAMDFVKWVLLANLFAWPAAYLVTRRWLRDFSFRVPFQPWPFLLASLATLVIALGTISFQTLRAARAKPVNALREVG